MSDHFCNKQCLVIRSQSFPGAGKNCFSLFRGIRYQLQSGDGEDIRERPMPLFAFLAGAAFALTVRTLIRALADRDARAEIMRWA